MNSTISPADLKLELAQFSGSDTFTRWSILFRNSVLTEGVAYLAEQAQCYWLMDLIASHQTSRKVRAEGFQTWNLSKVNNKWTAIADDGNGNVIAKQVLDYSDFPLDSIKLFAVQNELGGITIMLPGEY